MCKDREKLIERIRKLLAVTESNGATEHEAIAAALAAQKLMAESHVEEWELGEEGEPIEGVEARKTRNWQSMLAVAIADNFRCKCYIEYIRKRGCKRRSKNVVFYGYRSDAEAARLVYERLSETGNKLGKHYSTRRAQQLEIDGYEVSIAKVFDTWAAGFVRGVRDELEKQSQALMIVCPPKVNETFEQDIAATLKGHERINKRYRDDITRNAGRRAGRDAIRSGRMNSATTSHLISE